MPSAPGKGDSVRVAPTKIRPPTVDERFVRRTRLDTLLDGGARITLLVAPAGYGKTVLAAQWSAGRAEPIAWFTIDVHDSVPARFWRYVAAAIQRAVPAAGRETIDAIDDWAVDGIDMASVLLAELDEVHEPLTLVLDDLHHISSSALAEQLAFFLERAPEALRVVLISRATPALPLARWQSRGAITEIRQADLVLSVGEAHEALRGMAVVQLAGMAEDRLVDLAAGWPAALQLAFLSVRDRPDADEVLRERVGSDRVLLDYVVGELLDRLPDAERRAVMALSVLDDIDPRRCEALTDTDDGAAMLHELARLGLPLVALEPGRNTYRFHHLFRSLVRLELQIRDDSIVESLHRRAAAAELAAGDHPAAVRHLLAVGDHAAAFELVFGPVWDLYRQGSMHELGMWLDEFPPDFVGTDPRRMLVFATTLSLVGRLDDAEMWNDRAGQLVPDHGELAIELRLSRALVHLGHADTAAVRSECEPIERDRSRATAIDDPDARFATIRLITALLDGALDEAGRWSDTIDATNLRPERVRAVGHPARRAWLAFEQGSLDMAEAFAEAGMDSAGSTGRGATHALVELLVVRARTAAERLDVRQARMWADAAAELMSTVGSPLRPILHHELAHEAMIAAIEAGSGADAALDSVGAMSSAAMATPLLHRYRLMTAELLARAGKWDRCETLLGDLGPTPRLVLVRARLELGRNRAETASHLLDRTDRAAWPLRQQIEAELLDHRAEPHDGQHLRRAVALGAPRGFVWTFVREGAAVTEPVRRLLESEPEWRATPLATALRSIPGAAPNEHHALVEPLSARELEVLELLPTHLSTVELARRLFVSSNTVRTHIKAIYRKLGVSSRSEAVQRSQELGLPAHGRSTVAS